MSGSNYVLVTGSVHADIGKGTVAATLGRALALGGERVEYVKIDPCLQGPIDAMPDTAFGEIVITADGVAIDTDVSRAAFLIPGFVPSVASQRALGRTLGVSLRASHDQNAPSPRFSDSVRALADFAADGTVVVEVGGSAGEDEHEIVLDVLAKYAGRPRVHVHVTAALLATDGRPTTKPAQVGIRRLASPPDIVLVRGAAVELNAFRSVLPDATRVVRLEEHADAPEAAAWAALVAAGVDRVLPAAAQLRFDRHYQGLPF